MGEKERSRGVNHSEQADRIQDSKPPVSLDHAQTDKDERVSLMDTVIYKTKEVTARPSKKHQSRPSPLLETLSKLHIQNQILLMQNEQLQEKEEHRLQQARDSYARQRQQNPQEYKDKRAEYMREYRKRKKQQVSSNTE